MSSTPHGLALADSFAFRQHVNKALEGDGAADELVGALADAWADPDALRASLVPMHAPAGGRAAGFGAEAVKDSLVRLLLHVDPLQAGVAKALLEMLPALQAELEPESAHGGMPLPKLLLSQFRWLERVVDGEALLDAVGEMLQVVDPPLKRELVAIVPDLVQDAQHKRAVEVLTEVMEEDTAFTAPVLDALGSLVLEPRALAEVCTTVTDHVPSADVADLPVVIRFLLHHMTPAKGAGGGRGRRPKKAAAADDDDDDDDDDAAGNAAGNAAAIVSALRVGLKGLVRPVAPPAAADAADAAERKRCEGETLVLDAIQSALRLRKELGPIVVGELAAVGARDAASEHVPIDWWLICALYSTALAPDRKKLVKVVKDKAATKGLAPALLRAAVVGHGAALRPHLGAQLELATALVKAPAPAARLLGRKLYCVLFGEFDEYGQRQELLSLVLTHAGSGNAAEVDEALHALVDLAADDAAALAAFSPFLTTILDYVENLTTSQARYAYDLFARIAIDATSSGSRLTDELMILIRKQLSHPNPRYKRLGVLGGCRMLSRVGARQLGGAAAAGGTAGGADSDATMRMEVEETAPFAEDDSPSSVEMAREEAPLDETRKGFADELIVLMLKHSTSADGSFACLLHELTRAVRPPAAAAAASGGLVRGELAKGVLDMVTDRITDSFSEEYLVDLDSMGLAGGDSALPVRGLTPALVIGIDDEAAENSIGVKLLPFLEAEGCVPAKFSLATLSGTFELLRVVEGAASETGSSLEAVDAVLGCPLLLFAPETVDEFDTLPADAQEAVCLGLYYAVDWLRELLNAFASQDDPHMRAKCLKRLAQLGWIEVALDRCLGAAPRFRLPGDALGAADGPKGRGRPSKQGGGGGGGPSKGAAKAVKKAAKAAAAAKSAKKQKRKGSDVDTTDDEGAATDAEADDGPPGGTAAQMAQMLGGGTSAAGGASSAAPPKKGPAPKAAAPPSTTATHHLPHLARVAAGLRPLTFDATSILAYQQISRSEINTAGETERAESLELDAPSLHYLLWQLQAKLKAALAGTDAELGALDGPALLARLSPILLALRSHIESMVEMLPLAQRYDASKDGETKIADFNGEPSERAPRYVAPSLKLMLQLLRLLVAAPRVAKDAACHGPLVELLGHFGAAGAADRAAAAASQCGSVAPPAPAPPADGNEACALAFDYFAALRPAMTTLDGAAELVALSRAIVDVQARCAGGGTGEHGRRAQLAELAASCLEMEDPSKKALKPTVVRDLFECRAAYAEAPVELMKAWADDHLPNFEEDPDGECASQPLLTKQTAPQFVRVLFALLERQGAKLAPPKLPKRAKEKGKAKEKAEPPTAAESAAALEYIASLHELVAVFAALVDFTRQHEGKATLVVSVLKHSAGFLKMINVKALPVMSAHFKEAYQECQALLKAAQPATRVLQAHCAAVKTKQVLAALAQGSKLKRELELLICNVKVMLSENGCRAGFWMGNLKHKNARGEEVASQMMVDAPGAKAKGKRKAVEPVEEEDEDEDDDEEAPADGGEEEDDDGEEDEDAYPASMLGDDDEDDEDDDDE